MKIDKMFGLFVLLYVGLSITTIGILGVFLFFQQMVLSLYSFPSSYLVLVGIGDVLFGLGIFTILEKLSSIPKLRRKILEEVKSEI